MNSWKMYIICMNEVRYTITSRCAILFQTYTCIHAPWLLHLCECVSGWVLHPWDHRGLLARVSVSMCGSEHVQVCACAGVCVIMCRCEHDIVCL